MSCSIGRRHGLDLVLLWHRLAAAALIGPLAWKHPYTAHAPPASPHAQTQKKAKKKKLLKELKETMDKELRETRRMAAQ